MRNSVGGLPSGPGASRRSRTSSPNQARRRRGPHSQGWPWASTTSIRPRLGSRASSSRGIGSRGRRAAGEAQADLQAGPARRGEDLVDPHGGVADGEDLAGGVLLQRDGDHRSGPAGRDRDGRDPAEPLDPPAGPGREPQGEEVLQGGRPVPPLHADRRGREAVGRAGGQHRLPQVVHGGHDPQRPGGAGEQAGLADELKPGVQQAAARLLRLAAEADQPGAEGAGVSGRDRRRRARHQADQLAAAARAGGACAGAAGGGPEAAGLAEPVQGLPERDRPGGRQRDPARPPGRVGGRVDDHGEPAPAGQVRDRLGQRPVAEGQLQSGGPGQPPPLDRADQRRGPSPDLRVLVLPRGPAQRRQRRRADLRQRRGGPLTLGVARRPQPGDPRARVAGRLGQSQQDQDDHARGRHGGVSREGAGRRPVD